ncbi:MKI67 FHA domain-interacting nucleolar phosphoprotein-like protein, partial [Stegodyphus mimosarum]
MMNTFVENVRKKLKGSAKGAAKTEKPKDGTKSTKRKAKKLQKSKKKVREVQDFKPGTVYIGHIPHGFYEKEILDYFRQFGKVLRMRLARSSKTGRSKGFAFIEFESEEVAKTVAEAMNNYLFFEKLLKCEFVPQDKLHPDTFSGWKKRMPLRCDKNRWKQNRTRSAEDVEKSKARRIKRLKKLKA